MYASLALLLCGMISSVSAWGGVQYLSETRDVGDVGRSAYYNRDRFNGFPVGDFLEGPVIRNPYVQDVVVNQHVSTDVQRTSSDLPFSSLGPYYGRSVAVDDYLSGSAYNYNLFPQRRLRGAFRSALPVSRYGRRYGSYRTLPTLPLNPSLFSSELGVIDSSFDNIGLYNSAINSPLNYGDFVGREDLVSVNGVYNDDIRVQSEYIQDDTPFVDVRGDLALGLSLFR